MRQETRLVPSWLLWALGSAGFAALTAIFAKVGVEKVAPDVRDKFFKLYAYY